MNKIKFRITYEDSCEFQFTVWRSYVDRYELMEAFKDVKIISIEEIL